MKYLKSFNESLSNFLTDPDQIRKIMDCNVFSNGSTYKINTDGSIDVEGDVKIPMSYFIYNDVIDGYSKNFGTIPVKFRKVIGNFHIEGGNKITSLEGCPEECQDFRVYDCEIKNLKGGPKIVRGNYDVQGTPITSLEGSPEEIYGYFDVSDTLITSLVGGPKRVGTHTNIAFYDCTNTKITSLIGAPENLGLGCDFRAENTNITSLEGLPKSCNFLFLSSNRGTIWDPRPLRDLNCNSIHMNEEEPVFFLCNLFYIHGDNDNFLERFIESLDYNYIRGTYENPQINLFRLKEALTEFGIGVPAHLEEDGTIPEYTFVDDEGKAVNFWGDPI